MKPALAKVAGGMLLVILALWGGRLSAASFHKLVVDGELEAVRREINRDSELATINLSQ